MKNKFISFEKNVLTNKKNERQKEMRKVENKLIN